MSATDDRLRELATGFALGELSDAELSELHGLLTADPDAACVAWETLGTVTDLRSHLGGPVFAEAVRLKIAASGRFERNARKRLGLRRGLDPVEAPDAPPRRRLPWILLIATLGLGCCFATWLALRPQAPARVGQVLGQVRADGAAIAPGAALDSAAPLAIPGGAAVGIIWRDGSTAVVAGPATAVAQPGGLSLVTGSAWVTAGSTGLVLGLPDRRLEIPGRGKAAVTVLDGIGMAAIPAGSPIALGGPPPGQVVTGKSVWPWLAPQVLGQGAMALPGPEWRLEAEIGSGTGQGAVRVRLSPGPVISLSPGGLRILQDGQAPTPPITLSGPPLAPHHLRLDLHGGRLDLRIDDAPAATVDLPLAPTAVGLEREEGAAAASARLSSGPAFQPPLPLSGW